MLEGLVGGAGGGDHTVNTADDSSHPPCSSPRHLSPKGPMDAAVVGGVGGASRGRRTQTTRQTPDTFFFVLLLCSEVDREPRTKDPPLLKDSGSFLFFQLKKNKQISYRRYINIYRKLMNYCD